MHFFVCGLFLKSLLNLVLEPHKYLLGDIVNRKNGPSLLDLCGILNIPREQFK